MPSTHSTAAESKSENILAMGRDLGELYDALWQQVAWLHRKWAEYVEMFGTKESRIKLLNESAPAFFRIVQDTLWEDVLLHIARLTDSPQSVGKPNLSVRRLPSAIVDPATRSEVEDLIAKALSASEFCRDWRNRHIAHRDLGLALGHGVDPLKPASREKVRQALSALVAVLNSVALHYRNSTTYFDVGVLTGGAVTLLYVLDDGLKADVHRNDRLTNGTYSPEDYAARDL